MKQIYDFPSRKHISYSFTLVCDKNANPLQRSRKIIASDLNPVFVPVFDKIPCSESIYQKMDQFEKLILNDQLTQSMSQNHRGRGQNLLYCDGSVDYNKDRIVNGDDIFTVKGVTDYTGCETPASENDTFLAP